jgi:hypothetical protein
MLKPIGQFIFSFLLFAAVALVQLSFVFALPPFFNQINLILIVVIFTLFFFDFRTAVLAALIAGFWLDIFSFSFFGLYLIALFFAAGMAYWILTGWLTNRSLYSFLLLMLITTIGYNLAVGFLLYFSVYDQGGFFLNSSRFWLELAYQIFWSVLTALLIFSLAGLATRRLKPFFLEKK